ncbi:MAG: hypothetical protein WC273_04440 [Dehalococcoidia bacterium]
MVLAAGRRVSGRPPRGTSTGQPPGPASSASNQAVDALDPDTQTVESARKRFMDAVRDARSRGGGGKLDGRVPRESGAPIIP